MVCTLGNAIYKKAKVVKYIRLLFLLFELDQAIRNGKYKPKLRLYTRDEVLIIDKFLLNLTT
ncbi:ATP-binding protein [Massilimicrobiota timonensis]|uniref:ATP-binding protein n=1 Tax=Massilimicrobiota timonensis TaxID=1776392 RepID=UPI0013A601A2